MSTYQRLEYWRERYRSKKQAREAAKPLDPIAALTDVERAYLAGLVDGEGCFQIMKHVSGIHQPEIQIYMTAVDLIKEVAFLLGVKPHLFRRANIRHKEQWGIRITGRRAVNLSYVLLPYLRLKTPHARLVISFGETYSDDGWEKALSEETKAFRASLKSQMHELNR